MYLGFNDTRKLRFDVYLDREPGKQYILESEVWSDDANNAALNYMNKYNLNWNSIRKQINK